jgi:Glycosyltransferase Family 4
VAALTTALVISFSDLASDPRVDRQIAALLTRHRVIAAGLAPSGHDGVEFIDITTPPLGLVHGGIGVARLLAGRFEAAYWRHPTYGAAYRRLVGVQADVVVANDAAALPIAARLGPPVVFDAHEYAPDQFNDQWWWRKLVSPYVRWQCSTYIPEVAAMTTVGQAIADVYEHEFGMQATVVTNAPPFADLEPTPVSDPVRILHHGVAARGRGLEQMVRLAELLSERFVLDLMLVERTPGLRERLIRLARGNPRVRFPPPVPMRELVAVANSYDVGLFLLPPINLHRMYALPNKLFEFIQGRLAVAIGPSPEMAAVVREYGCGVIAPDFTPEAMAKVLNALDTASIETFKWASHRAAPELCAERNADLVLGAVDTALRSRQ